MSKMIYRRFGSLSEKVSAMGFGSWAIGGESRWCGQQSGWGPSDDKASMKAIHRALDFGINFFDTANSYGSGKSELILGQALWRRKALICTKIGNRKCASGPAKDFSKAFMEKSLEESLRRLRRDCIDVLLLHSPPDRFDWLNYDYSHLETWKRAGKIRCYGVSCRSVKGAESVVKHRFGEVLEVIYNVLDRRAEKLFPIIQRRNIAFIARVPLASGFLTRKRIQHCPNFVKTDHRAYLSKAELNWRFRSAKKLSFLDAMPGGISCSALRFCLSQFGVSTTIPGMRSVQQVEENASALNYPSLSPRIVSRIKRTIPKVYQGWIFNH
jgi:myo-inositol catabolism protein IolS